MAVYVDHPAFLPNGPGLLLADTSPHLLEFALMLGLATQDLHDAGTPWEHFDLTVGRTARALRIGAQPLGRDALAAFVTTKGRGLQKDHRLAVAHVTPPSHAHEVTRGVTTAEILPTR